MSKLRVHGFTLSLDGYGAGPRQSREEPLGVGGEALHDWLVRTRTFGRLVGVSQDETGVDDDFAAQGFAGIGAWILGRNMFGPVRGPWRDASWKGWWGDDPPYHAPTFVLTHHARAPQPMAGGTTFHFVTGGIEAALALAREAAGERDVRLLGGAQTIRQYLEARLVDSLHLAIAPVLLGDGQSLLGGLDLPALGYAVTGHVPSPRATHVVLTRQG